MKKKILITGLFILCLAMFIISSVYFIGDVWENNVAKDLYSELRSDFNDIESTGVESIAKDNNFRETLNQLRTNLKIITGNVKATSGADIVGWITIPDTKIDYPIVKGRDNIYYLNHLYNGKKNSSGAIFMDYRNDAGWQDENTIIYGHHMKNGTMFKGLKYYKSQDFYDNHPYGYLYTADSCYQIQWFAGTLENGDFQFVEFNFADTDDFEEYISEIISRSTFYSTVRPVPGDSLITLCTCSYHSDNGRYMLSGRLVSIK